MATENNTKSPDKASAGFNPAFKSMGAMILMVIFIGMGERLAERFLPLYLIALGGSTLVVGYFNSMSNFLNAIYSFPGGYISERFGYKKALVFFTGVAMFGYTLVLIIPSWQAVFIGSIFFIAWTAITLPAIMGMVSKVMKKEKRTMGVTIHSLVRRIPMAIGPVIGGLLLDTYGMVKGTRIAFGAALILGLGAMLFILFLLEDDTPKKSVEPKMLDMFKNINAPLRNLLYSDILIRFAEQIPYAYIGIWVINNNGLSKTQFGILTLIEMVTAALIYIPVAYFADKYTKKPFIVITFVFFTLFPLALYFSKTFPAFVLAFVIRGLKEFGEPTRKALIMDLAPEDAKAGTFGAYYLIRDILVSFAALASGCLWNIAPEANFIAAFAFGLIGIIIFGIWGKDLKQIEKTASHP